MIESLENLHLAPHRVFVPLDLLLRDDLECNVDFDACTLGALIRVHGQQRIIGRCARCAARTSGAWS